MFVDTDVLVAVRFATAPHHGVARSSLDRIGASRGTERSDAAFSAKQRVERGLERCGRHRAPRDRHVISPARSCQCLGACGLPCYHAFSNKGGFEPWLFPI